MKFLSIRAILNGLNALFLLIFLSFSVFTYHSIVKISVNYDGLIKGFYQYKSLSDTDVYLKELIRSQGKDQDLYIKASESFDEFLKHAPVKTDAGIKMTQRLKNAYDNEIRKVKDSTGTMNEYGEFNKLVVDFNGLIFKYDIKDGAEFIKSFGYEVGFYILILTCLFFSLIVLFHRVVSKYIIARINEANLMADRIAHGDLTKEIEADRKDEIGAFFDNLKSMQSNLSRMIFSVKKDVQKIHENSHAIASGNRDLSDRTLQQASALQETAASMEQIKITVENNAQNAKSANLLVQQSHAIVVKGAETMVNAVASMKQVDSDARKISEISTVINSIARQTNILALNAAVEAARAGEQGRGFAVVASEVRSLAVRSGDAALEINNLINQAVKSVSDGTAQVYRAREEMNDIMSSVSNVSELMEEISVASNEQTVGISQIATAVNQMDSVTTQNSTLVEASAQMTKDLSDLVKNVGDAISEFKLDTEEEAVLNLNK